MPPIYWIIKRFFQKYQPIQKKLEEIEHSLEVEKFMQAIRKMSAEELNARLADSKVTIESLKQSVEDWLKNVNVLLEAEKVKQQLHQATLIELRKLNEAVANELRKVK